MTTLATETLAYVQNRDGLSVFTFRVLLEREPSMEHLKIINTYDPLKKGDRTVT